ncbi:protein commissureless 2 [Eurosta solidaginis]|uniref:protein commissureless 2 n=1 Tax=Eurosta solidaginis TaxID=178769 RepID=UPI0035315ED1
MEALRHSINFDISHDLPPFDTYAQQILENSKTITLPATPTTMSSRLDANSSHDILQRIGAALLNSVQLKKYSNNPSFVGSSSTPDTSMDVLNLPSPPNHIVIDSSGFESVDELQRQLEYDKFMNEVWIGIVLTLILISIVFCICSCFLYHQFRAWKRNYRSTVTQSLNGLESETRKLYSDMDDPVPEYTLVSGLPSYEAALELLNKTPQSCLIVHPSVFNIFQVNEKNSNEQLQQCVQHTSQSQQLLEATAPLLPSNNTTQNPTNILMAGKAYALLPTYEEANSQQLQNNLPRSPSVTVTAVNEKSTNVPKEQTKEKKHIAASMTTTNSAPTIATTMAMCPTVMTATATATSATTTISSNSEAAKHIKIVDC